MKSNKRLQKIATPFTTSLKTVMYEHHQPMSKEQQYMIQAFLNTSVDNNSVEDNLMITSYKHQLQQLKEMQDHINNLNQNGHFSAFNFEESSYEADSTESNEDRAIPQMNVQLVGEDALASSDRDDSETSEQPTVIRYKRSTTTHVERVEQKKPVEVPEYHWDNISFGNDETEHTPEAVTISLQKPVATPPTDSNIRESTNNQLNFSSTNPLTLDESQHFNEHNSTMLSVSILDLESVIEKKIQAMRNEFSGELVKLKEENNTLQYQIREANKQVVEQQQKKSVESERKIEKEEESEQMKWIKDLLVYLKEENSFLKDTLAVKEQELDHMQHSMNKLTEENIAAYQSIERLTEELSQMQDMIVRLQISRSPHIDQRTGLHLDDSSHTRISAIIDNMAHLEQSLTSREFENDELSYEEENRAIRQQNSNRLQNGPVSHKYPIQPTQTPNNTPLGKPSQESVFNLSQSTERQAKPRSKSPSTTRSKTPTRSTSPGPSRRSTTPNKTTRVSDPPNNRQRLDYMSERLLRSLSGGPKPEVNAKEVDRMVEEVKQEFERLHQIALPLKKVQDCVYLLGNPTTGRKLHLNVITTPGGKQLVVRLGGGYRDLLECLSKSVIKIARQ